MTDMDLFAPVGLWYTQRALNDPEFSLRAQSYAQRLTRKRGIQGVVWIPGMNGLPGP